MPTAEEIQARLPELIRSLNGLCDQLLGLLASPPPAEDPEADGDSPPDLAAELEVAIRCALHDYLEPLLRVLAAAARSGSGEPE